MSGKPRQQARRVEPQPVVADAPGRPRLGAGLEHQYVEPAPAEERRRRQTGRAAADDRDLAPLHGRVIPRRNPRPRSIVDGAMDVRTHGRPLPDEVLLDEEPTPQPERGEPRLEDPRLRDLSFRDWRAIVMRAGKEFLDDNAMMLASALAYSAFFAIPSVLVNTLH